MPVIIISTKKKPQFIRTVSKKISEVLCAVVPKILPVFSMKSQRDLKKYKQATLQPHDSDAKHDQRVISNAADQENVE